MKVQSHQLHTYLIESLGLQWLYESFIKMQGFSTASLLQSVVVLIAHAHIGAPLSNIHTTWCRQELQPLHHLFHCRGGRGGRKPKGVLWALIPKKDCIYFMFWTKADFCKFSFKVKLKLWDYLISKLALEAKLFVNKNFFECN